MPQRRATRPVGPNGTPLRRAPAATILGISSDRDALRDIVLDPTRDPFAVLPGTTDHTLAREIRLVADHNAYHIGEFSILRAVMDTWPKARPGLKLAGATVADAALREADAVPREAGALAHHELVR